MTRPRSNILVAIGAAGLILGVIVVLLVIKHNNDNNKKKNQTVIKPPAGKKVDDFQLSYAEDLLHGKMTVASATVVQDKPATAAQ